jgi:hypothetical protein
MTRPLKVGLDYFSHDYDASGDEKIEALRSICGNDGFAFYFICLERIYRTENMELDVSDKEALVILAKKIGVPVRRLAPCLTPRKMLSHSLRPIPTNQSSRRSLAPTSGRIGTGVMITGSKFHPSRTGIWPLVSRVSDKPNKILWGVSFTDAELSRGLDFWMPSVYNALQVTG